MDRYEMIKHDALWVIRNYGSPAQEKKKPGSRAEAQATRIADFVWQLENAEALLNQENLDLIKVTSQTSALNT